MPVMWFCSTVLSKVGYAYPRGYAALFKVVVKIENIFLTIISSAFLNRRRCWKHCKMFKSSILVRLWSCVK